MEIVNFFLFYFSQNLFLCVTTNSDEMNEETKKQRKEEVSKSIGFFGGTNTNKAGEIRQLTKLT